MSILPRVVVQLPCRHDIEYVADTHDPFAVAAAHLLPWHDDWTTIVRRAAHGFDDELNENLARQAPGGIPQESWNGQPSVHEDDDRVAAFLEFAVQLFDDRSTTDHALRAAGYLGLQEAHRLSTDQRERPVPIPLRDMQAFIQRSLASRVTVLDVAAAGDCSRATAERLFKRHTGHSIQTYVRNQKMERAAHLLRFTGHRVNEVARMVGFSDPPLLF